MPGTVPIPPGAQIDPNAAVPSAAPSPATQGTKVAIPQGAQVVDTAPEPTMPGEGPGVISTIGSDIWNAGKGFVALHNQVRSAIRQELGLEPRQTTYDQDKFIADRHEAHKRAVYQDAADKFHAGKYSEAAGSLVNLFDPHYDDPNDPISKILVGQWDSSAQAKQRMIESAKGGDTLGVIQHAAGISPVASQVDAAMTRYQNEPTRENLAHIITAAIPAFVPALMRGAGKLRAIGAGAGDASEAAAPAADAAEQGASANEVATQKSVKKVGLEPGSEGQPATTTRTPATEPEAAPTGTMHEPILQQSARTHVNKMLTEEGLKPLPDSVDLRDLGDQAGKQFYTRSAEGFAQIEEATGKNLNSLRQQLKDLYRQKAETFGSPEKEGNIIDKINDMESQAQQAFDEAKAQGVDVDQPLADWKRSKSLANWGEAVRSSVDPLEKSGTFNPSKYTPHVEKLYRSDSRFPGTFDESTGTLKEPPTQLEQAFGKERAEAMRNDAYAASEADQFIKNFKPKPRTPGTVTTTPAMPPTEAKALYDLVRKNTGRRFGVADETTNWGKVYKEFDKLSPAERAARFKNPGAVDAAILKQARRQLVRRVGTVLTVAGAASVLGVDDYVARKIVAVTRAGVE